MPRYKLNVPTAGTFLYGDGETSVVADSITSARQFLAEDSLDGAEPIYLYSQIGRCEILRKADIDNGDGHEDAEPGDTTVWYLPDDGRALEAHECRVWILGRPSIPWTMEPMPPRAISWRDLPIGTPVRHDALGSGEIYRPPYLWRASGTPRLPVKLEDGRCIDLPLGAVSVYHTATLGGAFPPPPRLIRALVDGEVVVEGVSERVARQLIDLRTSRLGAAWEAEQFAIWEAGLSAAQTNLAGSAAAA